MADTSARDRYNAQLETALKDTEDDFTGEQCSDLLPLSAVGWGWDLIPRLHSACK